MPPGLPDVVTLAQLANQFFSAQPAGASAGAFSPIGVPAGIAALSPAAAPPAAAPGVGPAIAPPNVTSGNPPLPASTTGGSIPALVPHGAAPNGLPEQATTIAPAAGGRAGSPALAVPEAYAAALPATGIAPAFPDAPAGFPVPSTPFYFLGEARALPAGAAIPNGERVTAQPFSLPGTADLGATLAGIGQGRPEPATPASTSVPAFYFLDTAPPQKDRSGSVPSIAPSAHPPFDVNAVRRDFPILEERVNGRPLVWFDNAATTQKPRSVIERLSYFYEHENSNIHRAAHELAARATDAYEGARGKVARFLGASSAEEIIFVRGATEAINLVAKSWGAKHIGPGDEIIVSHLEHHANIVPWQQLAAEKGAKLRVIPVDDSGQILLGEYQRLLNARTKLVAVTQVSNALGTVVPVKEVVDLAHRAGACALVDGAQSVSHMRVNVQALDADFFVFSGHKIFGPTGIGVVYGKRAILEDTPPWQGGGNMIADVTFERTVYHGPPTRFEAGTGNIADAAGLGAALDYVDRIGLENIARYEHGLLEYATQAMKTVKGLRLIGTAADKASVASFVLEGYKPDEVGKALNQEGIAVRAGHHCAQPILRRFGVEATVRPSLAFYNTCEEVDRMIAVLKRLAGR